MDASPLPPPRRLRLPIRNAWGEGEMAVLDFGDLDRPVDLVFVHANGFNALTYRRLLAPLSGSLRIWAPDLRGHGRTDLPTRTEGRRGRSDHAADLTGLIQAPAGPPPVLAGHSKGGASVRGGSRIASSAATANAAATAFHRHSSRFIGVSMRSPVP